MDDGQTFYKIDDNEVDYGLEESYIGLEDLKNDLILYLQDEIVINDLGTETEEFEIKIAALIDNLLGQFEIAPHEEEE